MTQVVTVHTDFTDLNQMTQGLVGRVNETHVILPASEPVDVGEWVQFAVTLSDGTPGFAGFGRCVTFVDNGEERLAHQRFDVVFDSLQFDPRGQEIYSHILTLGGAELDEAADADAAMDDGGFVDVSGDFAAQDELPAAEAGPSPEYHDGGEEEDATMVVDGSVHEVMARARVESVVPGDVAEVDDGEGSYPGGLDADLALDPGLDDGDEPMAAGAAARPHEEPAPPYVNGVSFAYPDGLPLPDKPPRPVLDAAERITPAPRPRA